VRRDKKRDESALSQRPFLVLKLNFICREHDFRDRFGKNSFLAAYFFDGLFYFSSGFENQYATVVQRLSGACRVGRWSKQSRSGLDGFRERLKQLRPGSSSGIHFARDKRLRGTASSDPTRLPRMSVDEIATSGLMSRV